MSSSREHPGEGQSRLVFKGTRLPVATVIDNLEDLDMRQERLQRRGILHSARRHFNTIEQL